MAKKKKKKEEFDASLLGGYLPGVVPVLTPIPIPQAINMEWTGLPPHSVFMYPHPAHHSLIII